jgi:hypothetical protein
MSDLSNLLGDVYGDHSSPDGPPVRREPAAAERAPEWAGDSQLDRAFENWVPGEPPTGREDLTDALSAALATPAPAPVVEPVALPTLAAAPAPAPEAPKAWTSGSVATAPVAVAVAAPAMSTWTFGDDDIFPMSRGGKKAQKK